MYVNYNQQLNVSSISNVTLQRSPSNQELSIINIPQTLFREPSLVMPTSHMYFPNNKVEQIFDFILHGDPFSNTQNVYVFLSGNQINWPYNRFHCQFDSSGSITPGLVEQKWTQILITCPVPKEELQAHRLKRQHLSVSFIDLVTNRPIFDTKINLSVYYRAYHNISIYTMIRDKGAELVEWIEYHLLIGIEHFYLYDHLSTDSTDQVLKPYMDNGIVTLIRWSFKPREGQHYNTIQAASMNHCLKNFGPFNRWIGYFDVDEYFQLNEKMIDKIFNKSATLFQLLDETYDERVYPGAVQFQSSSFACFLSQIDVLQSRYKLNIEKCKVITNEANPKMFIRPRNVPIMQNIHALEFGLKFKHNANWDEFGRFRHYNRAKGGGVSEISNLKKETGILDNTMERYVTQLRKRIIIYK